MPVTTEIAKVFEAEGAEFIRQLQALMISTGANASGRTSKSLLNEITTTDTRARMQITGGIGWAFVEQGRARTRRKGNGALRGIIAQWIKDKGIQPEAGMTVDTLAFLITRAIHARGTLLHVLGERREIYTAVLTQQAIENVVQRASNNVVAVIENTLYQNIKAK